MAGLESTTLRDFSGGWNVADSDLNLRSSYQPISDNVVRGVDGSVVVRQGTELFADFRRGLYGTFDLTVNIDTVNNSEFVILRFLSNISNMVDGGHITINSLVTSNGQTELNGIPVTELVGHMFGARMLSQTRYEVVVRSKATTTGTVIATVNVSFNTDILGGRIIHMRYFNRRLVVFTDNGEIGTVDEYGNLKRIWGVTEAYALSPGLVATRYCKSWSTDTYGSTIIACNGRDYDKPVQIHDDFSVDFLVDKASSTNTFVPRADYVVCLQKYVVFICTDRAMSVNDGSGKSYIAISARGTDGTFVYDTVNPSDAIEMDLSTITSSVEPTLLGGAAIRDKLYVSFYDKGMIGQLGIYTPNPGGSGADIHSPNFDDVIAEHGTVSQRTMVSLGNDVIMADYAGVPSVALSQQSGIYVPTRLSELIAPELQKHLAQLSESDLRDLSFATYNKGDRTYYLFLPIYSARTVNLPEDPFIFNDELRAKKYCIMHAPGHKLMERSSITIAGASAIGSVAATKFNRRIEVVSVINDQYVVLDLQDAPSNKEILSGGGTGVSFVPINNETIVYAFEYNREFKIRRWTRFRQWNFQSATISQRGKLYLSQGLKVFRYGDPEAPVYADYVGDWDTTWGANRNYAAGSIIRDATDDTLWRVNVNYTTPDVATFAEDRAYNPTRWEAYYGRPIKWAIETPWADLRERGRTKVIRYVGLDTEGTDRFTLSAFVNQIRNDPGNNELAPYRALDFTAGDTGGWNAYSASTWGSGRRTREEKLWPFGVKGKLLRWRISGESVGHVRVAALTMYYTLGSIR